MGCSTAFGAQHHFGYSPTWGVHLFWVQHHIGVQQPPLALSFLGSRDAASPLALQVAQGFWGSPPSLGAGDAGGVGWSCAAVGSVNPVGKLRHGMLCSLGQNPAVPVPPWGQPLLPLHALIAVIIGCICPSTIWELWRSWRKFPSLCRSAAKGGGGVGPKLRGKAPPPVRGTPGHMVTFSSCELPTKPHGLSRILAGQTALILPNPPD